jgi:hypothetical protein
MRPEYVEAVNRVSGGFTAWLTLIVPALIALYAADSRRFLIGSFLAACVIFWLILAFHADLVQEAREHHAQTRRELEDARHDPGQFHVRAFGAMFAPIIVSIQFVVAQGAFWIYRRLKRPRGDMIQSAES